MSGMFTVARSGCLRICVAVLSACLIANASFFYSKIIFRESIVLTGFAKWQEVQMVPPFDAVLRAESNCTEPLHKHVAIDGADWGGQMEAIDLDPTMHNNSAKDCKIAFLHTILSRLVHNSADWKCRCMVDTDAFGNSVYGGDNIVALIVPSARVLFIAILLMKCWQCLKLSRPWQNCLHGCDFYLNIQVWCARFLQTFCLATVRTDLEILNELEKQQAQFARKAIATIWSCIMLLCGIGSIGLLADAELLAPDDVVPILIALIVFTILKAISASLTQMHLDYANIFLASFWIWRYATIHQSWYEYWAPFFLACRIMQGIILGNARLTIFLYILVTSADCLCFSAHGRHASNPWLITRVKEPGWSSYIVLQVSVALLAIALTWSYREKSISEAAALLEARRSSDASSLIHRLLSGMCDAVVSLDGNLQIDKPCIKLAGMLLRRSIPMTSVTSRQPFVDLVASSDQARFMTFMDSALSVLENPIDNSPCCSLFLNLLDVNKNAVPVEVFCCILKSESSGAIQYLLGLKEELDEGPVGRSTIDPGVQSISIEAQVYGVEHAQALASVSETQTSSDDWVSVYTQLQFDGSDHSLSGAIVELLAFQDTFPILSWNDEMAAIAGPTSFGTPFINWLPSESAKISFRKLVQDLVNTTVLNVEEKLDGMAELDAPVASHFGKLRFRPPGLCTRVGHVEFTGTCSVLSTCRIPESDLANTTFEWNGEDGIVVVVAIVDIQHKYCLAKAMKSHQHHNELHRIARARRTPLSL